VAAVVVGVLLGLSFVSALSLRGHLQDARAAMNAGKRELLAGDARAASHSFQDAAAAFDRAADGAESPWMRVVGWLPILGRTPDTINAIAYAGEETAGAGHTIAEAVARLPGGLGSLAPSGGRFPVERIAGLGGAVQEAATLVSRAHARLQAAPDEMLPGVVDDARWEAEIQLGYLSRSLEAASGVLEGLPGFLGADGPRRYFFGAQNPAEIRGTGGLIGAYSIVTATDGEFEFSDFHPIQELPLLTTEEVEPPSADYARNYNYYRSTDGFWLNANMTPDFPSAAEALELSYEAATGEQLDGVIAADPFALEALLEVTGPTEVPQLGLEVDAADVVAFTTNEAYARFKDAPTRKLVLGAVASGVFDRFLHVADPSIRQLRVLADAAGEGHISIFTDDEGMQAGLAATGVGGALPHPTGDFLSVVQNNGSASKVDFYLERTITHHVRLEEEGTATATTAITLRNEAPDHGMPRYVIGPFRGISEAGENVPLVFLYCGAQCTLDEAERDGEPVDLGSGTELGLSYYRDYFDVPSGGSARLVTRTSTPGAWEGNSSGGTYRLTFLSQTTIRPTRVRIEIELPEGMQVAQASESLRVEDDTLVYEGVPPRLLELEVRFRPPFLLRMWRNVTRPLSEPLLRIG